MASELREAWGFQHRGTAGLTSVPSPSGVEVTEIDVTAGAVHHGTQKMGAAEESLPLPTTASGAKLYLRNNGVETIKLLPATGQTAVADIPQGEVLQLRVSADQAGASAFVFTGHANEPELEWWLVAAAEA